MTARPRILHVYQQRIRQNIRAAPADRLPPIIIRDGTARAYASEVALIVEGREVGRLVYRPDAPLSCGARLWLIWNADLETTA